MQIGKDFPRVWLDIDRFNQAMNNIVSNAIKFTEKGSVILKVSNQEDKKGNILVRIEVMDTGFGIAQEQLENIGQPFTQASISTNRFYGGTGLGLPIVKSVVEAKGSTVKIEVDVGIGSRFYFDLELRPASIGRLDHNSGEKSAI